ncbi:MAG TPA: L-lactate dehydrogenase [Patescibacteria group bacterium]|nr:L-lactate dehydrogenase [Patescibacteria group bacterium]
MPQTGKVAVIGTGFVGATSAYAMLIDGSPSEIVLMDVNKEKALGELMDLQHGMSFIPATQISVAENYGALSDAEIVVITAGMNQKPGQSRRELVDTNKKIIESIVDEIVKVNKECIILMVTNPVDALAYTAWKRSGFPKERVFGSGTFLDTARLRYYIGEQLGLNAKSIDAYMLGEHGDSEFAFWSAATIGGVHVSQLPNWSAEVATSIEEKTRKAAYEIIQRKGATYYSIGLAVSRIVKYILEDANEVVPLSVPVDNYCGVQNVTVSVPVVLNRSGAHIQFQTILTEEEVQKLQTSAAAIQALL